MVRGKACSPPTTNTTTTTPSLSKPPAHHPYFFYPCEHHPTPLCVVEETECWKASPSLLPPPQKKSLAVCHWRDSVRCPKASVGEETLVNLPIACHRPRPGLFVSGTPLISPSTPSSVFPPSLLTQFLYPKKYRLKHHPFFLTGHIERFPEICFEQNGWWNTFY